MALSCAVGRLIFRVLLVTMATIVAIATMPGAGANDEAAVALGEKLFNEGRFSQPYFKSPSADVSMWSCATCHHTPVLGRGYADSEQRSPVPSREDGQRVTLRNSPALIDLFYGETPNRPHLLHYDGEFETPEALVRAGFTGRNFGWLAHEKAIATSHVAEMVRKHYVADFSDPGLEEPFHLDLSTAADAMVLEIVARLVSKYMRSLEFSKDASGTFQGSPYDRFLAVNGLPASPAPDEKSSAYTLRLLESVERLKTPVWVDEGRLSRHPQQFRFGPQELEGMKVFLKSGPRGSIRDLAHLRGIGNCASCHAPPLFTDFTFRNTGVSQEEYDIIHGAGAFQRLAVPTLAERAGLDPSAASKFASIPSYDNPAQVDLGAWNQLGPAGHGALFQWICGQVAGCAGSPLTSVLEERVQQASIAAFKTPTVRNLGHSGPFLHNGSRGSLEGVIRLYIFMGMFARDGRMRNADPEMERIFLDGRDIMPLMQFMNALNEEYE